MFLLLLLFWSVAFERGGRMHKWWCSVQKFEISPLSGQTLYWVSVTLSDPTPHTQKIKLLARSNTIPGYVESVLMWEASNNFTDNRATGMSANGSFSPTVKIVSQSQGVGRKIR
eukprot:918214-Ditylum_brightwellii.AAC.1